MRKSTVFWGTAIILIGVVLLISNVFDINIGRFIFPAILIVLGAWLLWGVLSAPRDAKGFETEETAIPLEGATRARIRFHHGAGRLHVSGGAGSGDLVSGSFRGGLDYQRTQEGDTAVVKMAVRTPVQSLANPWRWGPGRSLDWSVKLNSTIPLSLDLQTGASEARIDLTDLQVTDLQLQTGASSTQITLPASAGHTKVAIRSGAASVVMRVPTGVAARVKAQGGLADIRVNRNRFPRADGVYQSADYDTAENRVEIDIDTGVGSVEVK
jgi:predicted membrane protein